MMNKAYPASPVLMRGLKVILLMGGLLGLAACERTEPTPDPAPAPPTPRTMDEGVEPHIQRAVFIYTGSKPALPHPDGSKQQPNRLLLV